MKSQTHPSIERDTGGSLQIRHAQIPLHAAESDTIRAGLERRDVRKVKGDSERHPFPSARKEERVLFGLIGEIDPDDGT